MNPKLIIGCVVVLSLFAGNAATQEYSRIRSRIETTQAKVDALAEELKETTATIHAAIKSITDRFSKAIDDRAMQVSEDLRKEIRKDSKPLAPVKALETQKQPRIVMHSADEEKGVVCGPCRAWIKTEKAKWEKVGWDVQVVKEIETKRGWPWFEIYDRDGGKFEVDGPLTIDKFFASKARQ